MPVNSILLCFSLVLLAAGGCGAYLIEHSGEVVEAYNDVTTVTAGPAQTNTEPNIVDATTAETMIKPYNILETKPRPKCPEGFILAHKRCHKRAKLGE